MPGHWLADLLAPRSFRPGVSPPNAATSVAIRRLAAWLALVILALAAGCQSPPAPTGTTAAPPTAGASSPSVQPLPPTAPTPVPAGSSRATLLKAANEALQAGDAARASDLFQQLLGTPATPGDPAPLSAAILGQATFGNVLALLALGREDDARRLVDAARSRAASDPFARLAAQLYDQYGMTGDLAAACASVNQQAGPLLAEAARALDAAGVALAPDRPCVVPTRRG
ncbi:MAG: hypothetical protein HYX52_08845 [Chloroflexi bacterium]|nr:hypothetical protein [Chloroflexota bacterium]